MHATLFFLLKIYIIAISFYWRNVTPTFCRLTEFIPKSFHPWDYWSFALFVRTCSSYATVCLFFQRTHFFHWLPWQILHQRVQRRLILECSRIFLLILPYDIPMGECNTILSAYTKYMYSHSNILSTAYFSWINSREIIMSEPTTYMCTMIWWTYLHIVMQVMLSREKRWSFRTICILSIFRASF